MNGLSASKLAGLLLIAGPILMLSAIVLTPGGIFVASARAGQVIAIIRAMGEYPTLAHLSANLGMIGAVLAIWGFWHLMRAQNNRTVTGILVQSGVLTLVLALAGLAIGRGMTNLVVHILTAPAVTEIPQQQLYASVGTIEAVRGGFRITAALILFIGSLALGVGLASRFAGGIQKGLSIAAVVLSAAAILSFFLAQYGDNPALFYRLVGIAGIVIMLWYLVLGIALYRGSPALTGPEDDG